MMAASSPAEGERDDDHDSVEPPASHALDPPPTVQYCREPMINRKGSAILGHPLTRAAFRADPVAGGDGLSWSGAMRPIPP
jgi:hypothetical protein